MKFRKNKVAVTLAVVMGAGVVSLMPVTASSAVLSDGNWALTIIPTPTSSTSYGFALSQVGTDGNWNSSFTYGALPGPIDSLPMTDNGSLLGGKGSSLGGDGVAGIIEMNVVGVNITVPGTSMTGSVDSAGNMTFNPTGRLGLFDAFTAFTDLPFYINDAANCSSASGCTSNGNTTWTTFSTGSASALFTPFVTPDSINGSALTNTGDLDGDGINDFQGVLVSGGQIGSQWGGFFGVGYLEAWNVEILSGTTASGFNVDTVFGGPGGNIAQYTSAVPIPAALYLFGSGLVGLLGVAQRKKA